MKLVDKFIYFAFIYLIYRNKWVLVESSDTSSTPPTAAATDTGTKTGVELSLKKTSGTNEFDYKKEGNAVTYTAKSGFGFSSVKTKSGGCSGCCGSDLTIWDAKDANEYASKVVLEGKGDKNKKVVTIHLANGSKKVFTRGGNDKPWTTVSPPAKDTPKTTGTTLASSTTPIAGGGGASADGSGGGGTETGGGGTESSGGGTGTGGGSPAKQSNDTETSNLTPIAVNIYNEDKNDFYENKLDNNVRTFTAKDKYAFNCTFDFIFGTKVEFWKTTNENEYAKKVEVEGDIKVTIYIGGGDSNKKVFMSDGKNEQWSEFDESKVNLRSVNITHDKETYYYTFKSENNVRTIEAKDKFALDKVYEGKNDIWTAANEKEYAKKVVAKGNKKVTIHIGDGTSASTKVFNKGSEGTWTVTGSGIKTGVELSLKVAAATDEFDYKKDGKIVTYTANDDYCFNSVKTGETVVWTTDNPSEYSTKVILDGKGKKEKKVTIYFPNNTTKVFNRDGKGKPWNDVSPQPKDSAKTTGSTSAGGTAQGGGGGTQQSTPATQ